jgi:hypothetical protein
LQNIMLFAYYRHMKSSLKRTTRKMEAPSTYNPRFSARRRPS